MFSDEMFIVMLFYKLKLLLITFIFFFFSDLCVSPFVSRIVRAMPTFVSAAVTTGKVIMLCEYHLALFQVIMHVF